jgi:hypothetical protein
MRDRSIHIDLVRSFGADGKAYFAFHHLLAAQMGALLLVPVSLAMGSLVQVVHGCPVPWEEVHAVIEYPQVHPLKSLGKWGIDSKQVQIFLQLGLDPEECEFDHINPMVNGKDGKVLRLVHPSGVRLAVCQ